MKYFLDFLAELKKGEIAPVFLFYGPEDYLRHQAVRRLREALLPPGAEEFDYQVLDGTTVGVRDIVSAAGYKPLMAGRRLVVVRNTVLFRASPGKGDGGEEHFLAYLSSPSSSTCLVLETPQDVDRRRKIYKEVTRVGRAIQFARLKPADLVKWLAKLAGEEGCTLRREAAEELLARCGRDMYTLYNEMQKLVCFAGAGRSIGPEAVRELVTGRAEESIFEVVDAIGEKNCPLALAGIRRLLLSGHQPQQIIGMTARQLRLIWQVKQLAGAGYSREQIISVLQLHPFVYRKIHAQRNNFRAEQLVKAINELNELDYKFKTGRVAFYPGMETFILRVCAEK